MEWIVIFYLIFMSLLAFLVFGFDKKKAKRGRWRIPEKTLFTLAALGGSLGAWLGMRVFRHKTKHPAFRIGIPLLTLLNLVTAGILCFLL